MEPYNLSNTTLVTKEYFEELKRKAEAFNRIVEVYSDNDLYSDEDLVKHAVELNEKIFMEDE